MTQRTVEERVKAVTSWDDLLVRNSFSDTGEIPAKGALCFSPDIIPSGTMPHDPRAYLADMNKDYGVDPTLGANNYFYVRGINTSPDPKSGEVHLYACPAGLLCWPSNWQELPLDNGHFGVSVAAPGKGKFVTESGYLWVKTPPPPQTTPPSEHYCLISRLSTHDHPNPVPTQMQLPDFAQFIANNRGMAWRNVRLVYDPNLPQYQTTVRYQQGDTAHLMYFMIITKDVPVGCEVGFQCASAGPNPPIALPKTRVTVPNFFTGMYTEIPAGFDSVITYELWSNGHTLPTTASVKIQAVFTEQPDDPALVGATDLRELVPDELHHPEHRVRLKDGPVHAIVLGDHTTAMRPTLPQA